jgi:superfamily II DNA or RNA helicase
MKLRDYQINLINDVRQAYLSGKKRPCIVLPCGGGKSVIVADMAKKATEKGNRVLFLVHRKELCDQIEDTFRSYGVNMKLCKIGMVQTITRRLMKMKEPALIIIDESHHVLAKSYTNIIDYFPNARCVGVTATPCRLNGGGLGDINDQLIIGVSTKYLIENNFLAPYDYYAPSVADLTGLHVKVGEYVTKEIEERLIKKSIFGDVISYYRQLADGKQAICYCASISHSQQMAENFRDAGISAAHIDGSTLKVDRNRIINAFRAGEIKILCNVDLISEGFDVPDCECAILLRPTKSLTLYIQQSMRCMRFKPSKKAVIIDHVGNYARFGLPDQDREWTLEPKKKGKKKEEPEVKVRQCPECFFTHEWGDSCPKCGFVYPIAERTLEEIKEAKLELINEIVMDYDTPDNCTTMAELVAFGKKRGYKPGWAFYQAKQRGIV